MVGALCVKVGVYGVIAGFGLPFDLRGMFFVPRHGALEAKHLIKAMQVYRKARIQMLVMCIPLLVSISRAIRECTG